MEVNYLIVFTAGFLGGFGHCIGMCGPIVASYAFHDSSSPYPRKIIAHLIYNSGRITTYVFIGALMGLTGSFINIVGRISGFQDIIAGIAGLFMIIMGLNITGISGMISWLEKHNNIFLRTARQLLGEESIWRYLLLGALFGFLPCGLSYSAFIAAAGTGDLFSGILITFFFGIGTLPALLFFGIAASYISSTIKGILYKTAGITVTIMGILYLMKAFKIHG